MMELFEKTKEFIDDAYKSTSKEHSLPHFQSAVDWLLKLNPDAEEYLLVAAYAHDCGRAFSEGKKKLFQQGVSLVDENILREHQDGSADVIVGFLRREGVSDDLVSKIDYCVRHHEEGGNSDADLIKDADSLSYFDVNVERHLGWLKTGITKDQLRGKIDWMYERITSPQAKEWAKPMYDNAIKLLICF